MTEASNKGQIGHPAAWMIANKSGLPVRFLGRFLPRRKEWRDFSKNQDPALSTKLVDKFVDCLWKCPPIILAARADLGPVKCSAVFSDIETARYV